MADRDDCPQPWISLLRKNWPVVHTIDLQWKHPSDQQWKSAWRSAVVADTTFESPDEPGKSRSIREDPGRSTVLAFEAWNRAHEKLEEEHRKNESVTRLEFRLAVIKLDRSGALVEHDYTTRGGKLGTDGSVDDASDDTEDKGKATLFKMQAEHIKFLQDANRENVSQVVKLVASAGERDKKSAELIGRVGDLLVGYADASAGVREAEISAEVTKAKYDAAAKLGMRLLEAKAPAWRAEAHAKMESKEEAQSLEDLCKWTASKIDGTTCLEWEAQGVAWQQVVALLARAGELDQWEPKVRELLQEFGKRPQLWACASPPCVAAFERLFDRCGIPMDGGGHA